MTLVVIATREDGAVIASDDGMCWRQASGDYLPVVETAPKFWLLAADLVLAVGGSAALAVLAHTHLQRSVDASARSERFQRAVGCLDAGAADWYKAAERCAPDPERLPAVVALLGIDGTPGALRLATWASLRGSVLEWPVGKVACFGAADSVKVAGGKLCRTLAAGAAEGTLPNGAPCQPAAFREALIAASAGMNSPPQFLDGPPHSEA